MLNGRGFGCMILGCLLVALLIALTSCQHSGRGMRGVCASELASARSQSDTIKALSRQSRELVPNENEVKIGAAYYSMTSIEWERTCAEWLQ